MKFDDYLMNDQRQENLSSNLRVQLICIFERARSDMKSPIFAEICKVLVNIASQSSISKRYFASTLYSRKDNPTSIILDTLKSLSFTSKSQEVTFLFDLVSSLVLTTENANFIIKLKTIEEISKQLSIAFKTEKDIQNAKVYLLNFFRFLGAYT
jgi:hypothetical protein